MMNFLRGKSNKANRVTIVIPHIEPTTIIKEDPVNTKDLDGLGLEEITDAISFPHFYLPTRPKYSYGVGSIEIRSRGFLYTEWDSKTSSFSLYISYEEGYNNQATIHISTDLDGSTFSPKELSQTVWADILVPIITTAWILRHGIVAKKIAENKAQEETTREQILRARLV